MIAGARAGESMAGGGRTDTRWWIATATMAAAGGAVADLVAGMAREEYHPLVAGVAVGVLFLVTASAVRLVGAARRAREGAERRARDAGLALAAIHGNDIVLVLTPEGRIIQANERAAAAYGRPVEALIGANARDLRDPATLEDLPRRFAEVLRPEGTLFETRHQRADGTTFPVEVSSRAFQLEGEPTRYIHSVIRDLTERRRTEEERARHASLLDQLDDGVIAFDEELRVTAWNPAAARITGHPEAAALGQEVLALLGAELPAGTDRREVAAQVAAGELRRMALRSRRRDGRAIDLEVSLRPLRGTGGRIAGFVSVARDVTEERRARDALARREAQLGLVASRLPAGVMISTAAGDAVFVNEGFAALAGRPPEALLGFGWRDAIHPGDLPLVEPGSLQAHAADGGRVDAELRIVRPDGALRWCQLVALPLDGSLDGRWISFAVDVTEARALAERATRAERLAGLGALAGGMAHRINNPLAAVLGAIRFALEELRPGAAATPEVLEALREGESDGRRIAAIVRDLESFANPGPSGGLHDPLDPLREALRMAEPDLGARSRISLDLGALPLVRGERTDLRQLFLHLLRNAWQALPEGRAADHQISIRASTDPAGAALIEIADDGVALSSEGARHAFEPFRAQGEGDDGGGTGLGLSVCWGIATGMGGTIELERRAGGGTAVRLRLPAAGG